MHDSTLNETMKTKTKFSRKYFLITLLLTVIACLPTGLFSQLAVGVSGDATINKCEIKQYTISIQNNSGNDLTNLAVTGQLGNFTGFAYYYSAGTHYSQIDVGGSPICNGGGDNSEPVISGTDLIWNINTRCPNNDPFTLSDGQTLNITFWLQTDCSAVSGSLNVLFEYEIGGTPTSDNTGALSIQVNPGAVNIRKEPNVIPQEVGQNVTWTIEVENSGLGVIENVEITDILGAGLQYVSSSPVSSTVTGGPGGETIFWDANDIPALASMNPGDVLSIDITATVIACDNLDNIADARWGCSPGPANTCYNTAVDGGTARASVQHIPRTPLIDYAAPDITFNYCDDYVDISFPVNNIGDGPAYHVWTVIDFPGLGLTVSNVSAGATYNSGAAPPEGPRFEITDPIPAGGTYDLSFRLTASSWCGTPISASDLLWQKIYEDGCGNRFYPPVELSRMNAPTGGTGLTVAKTVVGGFAAIQIGTAISYDITSAYTGSTNCGSPSNPAGIITVTDTVPDGFTVTDAGGGVWTPGGGGTGGTIVWTYTPPASLTTAITLQAPSISQCETYCNSTFTNNIAATGIDCCGCTLNASDSVTTAIECEEGVDSEKTVSPTPGERCGQFTYTNTYTFDDVAGNDSIDVSSLVFTERAEYEQQYFSGSLNVTIEDLSGGGPVSATACATAGITDTTPGPGGTFRVDFSGCGSFGSVRNKQIVISYILDITEDTVTACAGRSFYSWSELNMGATGSDCLANGIIHETTRVTVEPPAMSVSINNMNPILHKCEEQSIDLVLTQTSTNTDAKDVRLVLSGLNYYVTNPASVSGVGVTPTSGTFIPTIDGSGNYIWEFGDNFSFASNTTTITINVRKRCTPGGALEATAYWDDTCNDQDAPDIYNDSCSTTGSASPSLLLSGDLLIEKTPETYYASDNNVQWKIYVTNRGTGSAYNVWIDDVMGSGLIFDSATVDGGVWAVNPNIDHESNAINGANITIDEIPAGIRREITFNATYSSCVNLTNEVTANWGCVSADCQTDVSDTSTISVPAPLVVHTNVVDTPVNACSSPQGYITIKNAGQISAYNVQVTETLPAGLLYVSGSTRWRVYTGGAWGVWNGPNVAYDPNPATSPLQWTPTEILGLTSLGPGERIEIEFDFDADCPFSGGTVTLATQYENPCGQVFSNADSNFTVAIREPDIEIVKTANNDVLGCTDAVTWTIDVTNNSTYMLETIWLEDMMGDVYTFTGSTGDATYTGDSGTNSGQVTVWEIRNLPAGATAQVTISATTDGPSCNSDMDNTVRAWWGCGAVDGLSTTKPGDSGSDSDKCLSTSLPIEETNTPSREPTVDFQGNIGLNPASIDSCNDSTEMTVTINNGGRTDSYDLDLVITLPANLTYNAGTTEMCIGADDSCVTGAIGDPSISAGAGGTQVLTFYDIGDKGANLTNSLQADGGNDTIVLKFTVATSCYTTADVNFDVYYYDCCGSNQFSTNDSITLTANYPQLAITKTPATAQIDCSTGSQEWVFTVTNNGTGNAQVVRVEDTPGAWLDINWGTFNDVDGTGATVSNLGGGVYGWEFNNLGPGSSAEFRVSTQLNPNYGLPAQANCNEIYRQNTATVVWGCGTAGDAVDADALTTAYDCTDGTPVALTTNPTLQMPNLEIAAITPINLSCSSDGTFSGSIRVQVRNSGDGVSTGNFDVSIDDGQGFTASATYSGGSIAAGATVNIDISGWTPSCQSCAAPFQLVANVDTGNAICECNESDNTNSASPTSFSIDAPDLEITGDTIGVACSGTDGQVTVSGNVTVRNNGCVSAFTTNIPIRVTVYDAINCQSGSGSVLGTFDTTLTGVNIAANGGTQNLSFSSNLTADFCGTSQVSVRVQLDPGDVICECDGTNNDYCTNAINVNIPDLQVTGDNISVACFDDGVVQFSGNIQFTNSGQGLPLAANIPVRFNVYDNTNCSSGAGSVIHTWTDSIAVNLAAGASTSYNIANHNYTANLVTLATGCNISIEVIADYNNSICECDGTNNTYCTDKAVNIPDLEVASEAVTFSCASDGNLTASGSVTLRNNGCGSAYSGGVPVRFELFPNGSCGGAAFYTWDETLTANINAGGGTDTITISNETFARNLCSNSATCSFSLRVTVDPDDTVCESDGTDNVLTCSTKTSDVGDLVVNSVTPSISCTADGSVTGQVLVNVSNNGCGNISGAVLSLSTTMSGVSFPTPQTVTLNAGTNNTYTFNFTPSIADCSGTFTATVDPGSLICECDNSNNTLTSAAFTMTLPDLEVSADTLAVTCNDDGEVLVSGNITVRNNGCTPAQFTTDIPVRITLYNNTGGPSGSGTVVGTQVVTTLGSVSINPGGGTQQFAISETFTGSICANSQVSVYIELDHTTVICEFDGTNNNYTADGKTVNIPDVRITGDNLSVDCQTDGQIRVSGTLEVTNSGQGNALTSDIPVRLTMYSAPNCASGSGSVIATWTDTLTGISILPGNSANFAINNHDITANLTSGSTNCQVSIRVEADYDTPDAVCECDGTNNDYCTDKNVDIPDIEVVSDTLEFTCTTDGNFQVSGTVTIRNSGCGNPLTDNIDMRFTLYDNVGCNTGSGSQVAQWTETLTGVSIPVAPGSNTQTFTISNYALPLNICSASAGWNMSIRFEADYTSSICESDGTDNELCSDKTVAIPDLTISAVASSVTCLGDGSLTGTTVTVTNTGNGDAAGVVVRLASDCGLTFSDQTVNVAAGASEDVFFPFTSGIVSCTCNFSAVVDPDNLICECDGTNNTGSSAASMLIPDLEVQSENFSVTCADDGTVQVTGTVTVVNNGCGSVFTDPIPVRFTLYGNWNGSGNQLDQWTVVLSGANISPAGGTQTFTIPAHISPMNLCTDTAGGRVSVRTELDYNNSICEWDGTDNTSTYNITTSNIDIEAVEMTATADCQSDGTYDNRLQLTIRNNGNSVINDDFYISVDDGRGWTAELRYSADLKGTFPLAAGARATVTFEWNRTFAVGDCTFPNITAVVDSRNQLCQCSVDNDTITTSITQPTPNLKPTAIEPSCSGDGTYSVIVTVENDGCGPAGTFTVNLKDNLGNTADMTTTETLAAGQSTRITFNDWPATCEPNSVTFTASVDTRSDVCEVQGPDNQMLYTFTNPSPDLQFTQVRPSANCSSDGQLQGTIDVTMQNNGNAPVTDDFKIIVNDGQGWSSERFYQAELGGRLPIAVGESVTARVNWNRDFTRQPFTCNFNNISVSMDPETSVCECAANNNETVTSYRLPYPDIDLEKLECLCEEGGNWKMKLMLSNNGCESLNVDFQIRFSDSTGETRTESFTALGGKLPFNAGVTQELVLERWPVSTTHKTIDYTVEVLAGNANTDFCDLNTENNKIAGSLTLEAPELYIGEVTYENETDGSVTFTFSVGNSGSAAVSGVPVTVYDNTGKPVYNTVVELSPGTTRTLTFTTGTYTTGETIDFRFVIDGSNEYCEFDETNNEKVTPVEITTTGGGEPGIELTLFCPPGHQQGGLFRFEVQVRNTGSVALYNAVIKDFLPEGFQYVPGSASVDGQNQPEPGNEGYLTFVIGTIPGDSTFTLVFTAVADADIDPGRYCNEAMVTGNIGSADGPVLNTERWRCCTVVTREAGAGCCLDVEEWPLAPYRKPDGPVSFIEPYFHTGSSMFTVYAALNLWKDSELEKGKMPRFVRERMRNYARSTVEEFYFHSRLGLTMPDGTLWLSHAGAYPEKDGKNNGNRNENNRTSPLNDDNARWIRKQVDETMTVSQVGFELMALNETAGIETDETAKGKMKEIIKRKLAFIEYFIDDQLPYGWEFSSNKRSDENKTPGVVDVEEAVKSYVKKTDAKAGLYDRTVLYLAMLKLKNAGYDKAGPMADKLRDTLKPIDNKQIDRTNVREELMMMAAMLESGETAAVRAKLAKLESLLVNENDNGTSNDTGKKDKTKKLLDNLHNYGLAIYVSRKAGGTLHTKLEAELKDNYYMADTGILAEKQPDLTFKLNLHNLAPVVLAFGADTNGDKDENATVLYRTFDEIGLFLKKRNLSVGKPLYSILKNTPFSRSLLPVLSFTRANRSIAPVFSRDAVVHSTRVKPLGEVLIPGSFSRILSPGYETGTARIARTAFGLQYVGRLLKRKELRLNKEEGRSLDSAGMKYIDSLLYSGAGIDVNGAVLLPFDNIAMKGPKTGDYNLEPLNSGTTFTTGTLADFLTAEKLYVEGKGKYADTVTDLMKKQQEVIAKFVAIGYVPNTFRFFVNKETGDMTVIPSKERASKMTIAKLLGSISAKPLNGFLVKRLKKAEGKLNSEDMIYLSAVPGLAPYFEAEISELIAQKDSYVSVNAADIIGRKLVGGDEGELQKSLDNLMTHWDKEAYIPKSDNIETVEKGSIYRHDPQHILLYLLATHERGDFRFKRTLNLFSYLLENEWGIEADNSFITLPSSEYRVFMEEPRQTAEPGDLLTFRVRVDNTCPDGFGQAHDLSSLYLKGVFSPPLVYAGTGKVDGLDVIGDFKWYYNGLVEGDKLEFMYQAIVPSDFQYDTVNGWIYAGSRQGMEDFGPASAIGDKCEDIDSARKLNFVPFAPLQGIVYEDKNLNGVKDVGETGIANIQLKDTRGRVFRTDAEGRFTVLAGTEHEGVQLELKALPANYLLIGSPTRMVNRYYTGDIHFGLVPCKTVHGFIYLDENGNGVYDTGETRPQGVAFKAKDKETVSGVDGEFIFRNLPELWAQWIEISQEQPFYKGGIEKLKFTLNKKEKTQ